jgi:SPOR domain
LPGATEDPPPEGGRRRMREALQRAPGAALLALAAVALLGGAAAGVALSEITSDDAPTAEQSGGPGTAAPPDGGGRRERAATDDTTTATPEAPRRLLLDWPAGLTAHTVVLVTSSDRPAALRLARQAARTGIEAGLLRADDYSLGSGLWIVFAGRFDTREGAALQATNLAERFPGAYPQLIRPAGG